MGIRRFDNYGARWARPLTASGVSEETMRAAILAAKGVDEWTAARFSVPDLSCDTDSEIAAVVADKGVFGFAADQPRVGPGDNGLLVHEPRTFHLAPSRDLSASANWTKTEITATDNNATSPDGDTQATKLLASTNYATHSVSIDVTVEDSTTYTFSAFLKPNSAGMVAGVDVVIGLASGDVTDQWVFTDTPDVSLADGWQRWSTTFETGASDGGTVTITLYMLDERPPS